MPPTGIERLDWAAPASFALRDEEFLELRGDANGIRMPLYAFRPVDDLHRWLGVSEVRLVENKSSLVLLEYSPLRWKASHAEVGDEFDFRCAIRWLLQLIDVHELIGREKAYSLDHFVHPLVKIDLWRDVRLAFASSVPSAAMAAPEFQGTASRWSDRTLVFMIGQAFARVVRSETDERIHKLVMTCTEEKPRKRFKTLSLLREHALELFEPGKVGESELQARRDIERGLGWLELGELPRALTAFTAARSCEALAKRAQQALDVVSAKMEGLAKPERKAAPSLAPSMTLFDSHFTAHRYTESLEVADQLVQRSGSGLCHYVRGKALFALARFEEARAAFDTACRLDGFLVEAMLLRREADRALSGVRARVGHPSQQTIDVPATLEELRDDLLSGDASRLIEKLQTSRFVDDADAQLVLARYLAMDDQHERALDVYDRVTAESHRFAALHGKASTLLAVGRDESALALFDQLVAERPSDAEASEGRARALEKLGRTGEAAAEYRRFVSLATTGSDLRVRAAQEWLDAHPL